MAIIIIPHSACMYEAYPTVSNKNKLLIILDQYNSDYYWKGGYNSTSSIYRKFGFEGDL